MDLTAAERATLDHQLLNAEAKLSLLEGKRALTECDSHTVIAKRAAVAEYLKDWSLRIAVAALRIASRIVLRLYRLREAEKEVMLELEALMNYAPRGGTVR